MTSEVKQGKRTIVAELEKHLHTLQSNVGALQVDFLVQQHLLKAVLVAQFKPFGDYNLDKAAA